MYVMDKPSKWEDSFHDPTSSRQVFLDNRQPTGSSRQVHLNMFSQEFRSRHHINMLYDGSTYDHYKIL